MKDVKVVKFFEVRTPGKLMALRHPKVRGQETESGIVVQSSAKPQEGTVVAVHPNSVYSVGETIVWNRFAAEFGAQPDGPQKEYLVIREDDILGVINEEEWEKHVKGESDAAARLASERQGKLAP